MPVSTRPAEARTPSRDAPFHALYVSETAADEPAVVADEVPVVHVERTQPPVRVQAVRARAGRRRCRARGPRSRPRHRRRRSTSRASTPAPSRRFLQARGSMSEGASCPGRRTGSGRPWRGSASGGRRACRPRPLCRARRSARSCGRARCSSSAPASACRS